MFSNNDRSGHDHRGIRPLGDYRGEFSRPSWADIIEPIPDAGCPPVQDETP
jgi:hypothetical protein